MTMIARLDLAQMRPEQKAELIYTQARSELTSRLWRAALGDGGNFGSPEATPTEGAGAMTDFDSLLAALGAPRPAASTPTAPGAAPVAQPAVEDTRVSEAAVTVGRAGGLGVNARHEASLNAAAARTGIPAAALAAIVDAEAAKDRDGGWKAYSRNPRSSAAGLGQFLSGTWQSEAERPGTWLNGEAKARGWLTENGKVARGARAELLALRYDAGASIQATADYARGNLDRLRRAGVAVGDSMEGVAHAAYLGHHLGVGDAIKFMKGGLDSSRARLLLSAQVGAAAAGQRIAAAGDATDAHRAWLLNYVGRNVRPARFDA
ncbi:peptidoglycan-binding protein [Sphingosinicella sp. LY1275]|uniref:peptidoglycan-binding protein n=1 Tax=Sphingosinicella sp. LY1275 TaxID=3095379 RepID=UPI002ADEEE36|nr:peptidoglycan-binding protein [Sphingosinicella sp. LY1275]MEA1013957.1 peptidoglycan-binding protein [Sphingosinicella sp. LY1275]